MKRSTAIVTQVISTVVLAFSCDILAQQQTLLGQPLLKLYGTWKSNEGGKPRQRKMDPEYGGAICWCST